MKKTKFGLLLGIGICAIIIVSCSAPETYSSKPVSQSTEQKTPEIEKVSKVVNYHQDKLQAIYKKHTYQNAMQGDLEFTLYITNEGKVQEVEVKALSGKFFSNFIDELKKEIFTWAFPKQDKIIYSFVVSFRKG
ncbi:MAG TPA: AgmX/PglI C-terminal domain-containing protein [Candidatus Cloacimonas acidaminovorans]|jgi:hypothetical protein|nr:AgmX/PglI C-terminal domain-containing protein [Candidatus Cloacimonas acidaminovorans]HRS60678.1 AgmX/PglI C-terminal domain-containing protein [Candidatus Cloacimonas sp.]MDY0218204.1 AgmX/PglI C-terminal domain-containing protein [Candidatus Cloacimonas acidaminovorans]HOE55339.1 AgmX/PglI C-terminal domain-containing protein [Candidatus Cloacimonas acidaminovorans]HOS07583.1 AgmX/PglI C-terminal domain-containing protein [Candidatus Cloacimonas acidaminovorans]